MIWKISEVKKLKENGELKGVLIDFYVENETTGMRGIGNAVINKDDVEVFNKEYIKARLKEMILEERPDGTSIKSDMLLDANRPVITQEIDDNLMANDTILDIK